MEIYIEIYFRNKALISSRYIYIFAGSSSIFFIIVGLAGHYSNGYPKRIPEKVLAFTAAADDKNPRTSECHFYTDFPIPMESCVLGNKNNIQGALLGDSHANAISYPLELKSTLHNIGFLSLTYSGCPPVRNIYRVDTSTKCNDFNNQTYEFLRDNKEIKYVILVSRWTIYLEKYRFNNLEGGIEKGKESYIDVIDNGAKQINEENVRRLLVKKSYQNMIEDLLKANKKIFLVYPIPEVGWDVPTYRSKKMYFNNDIEPISTSHKVYKQRNNNIIMNFDAIPNNSNLIRIRPDLLLCDTLIKNRCTTEINDSILYIDDDHLSNAGASLVVNEIMKFLN